MASITFGSIVLLLLRACLVSATTAVPLPALPGPYAVGTISLEAIDTKRLDPYAPTPQPRRLMISAFYPTTDNHHPFAPYLPTALAAAADQYLGFPPGFLEQIQTRSYANARLKEVPDIPVILFSPGLGSSREASQILLEGIASYGYFVVAMDHSYDAEIVEFPDGELVFGLGLNGDTLALETRTKDTSFVLDQLGNSTFIQQVPGIVHRKPENNHVAMFGHSLGGATTLQAMGVDRRIIGGCNLDGPLSSSQLTTFINRPFLQFGRANHTRFNDPAWEAVWKHLTGWRAEIELANSTHFTFLDDSAIFTEMGLISTLDPGGTEYGTINGIRATVVEIAYLKGFFDFVFGRGGDGMLRRPDKKFPEITID